MNRNYSLSVLLFFLISNILFAQEITIQIYGTKEKAVLFDLEGEKTDNIDSVFSQNGIYQFSLMGEHTGFYRLKFDNKHWIDFINDGKDVELKTDFTSILDSIIVIKSESNKLYYEFLKLNKSYKTKTELLQLILARYPKDDDYYLTTQKKLTEVKYKRSILNL